MGFAPDRTTTKVELNPEQARAFETLYQNALGVFNQLNKIGPYGGDFLSTRIPGNLAAGRSSTIGGANTFAGSGAGRDVLNLGQATTRGDFVDPNSPVTRGVIDATLRPVQERFQEVVLPSIRGGAVGQGAFDNVRRNLVEKEAGQDFLNTSADVASNIIFNTTQAERQRQHEGGQVIAQSLPLLTTPGAIVANVGEAERADADRVLQNELAKYESRFTGAQRPFNFLADALTPLLGTGSTRTTQQPGVSPIAGAISGGFGGASAAASLASALGASAGPFAIPGALLGILAGALS